MAIHTLCLILTSLYLTALSNNIPDEDSLSMCIVECRWTCFPMLHLIASFGNDCCSIFFLSSRNVGICSCEIGLVFFTSLVVLFDISLCCGLRSSLNFNVEMCSLTTRTIENIEMYEKDDIATKGVSQQYMIYYCC